MIKKLVKTVLWTVGIIVTLTVALIGAAVWYLSPERLTPMVENEVNKIIDGRLEARRIELTFWSSFPRVKVDIDDVTLVSNSLATLSHGDLPEDLDNRADSLLSVGHIHGSLNIPAVLKGEIELYDVVIERPKVNIVIAREGVNNFSIVPASEPSDPETETSALPKITIDRFRLIDAGPLSFTSLPDSLSVTANIENIDLTQSVNPVYSISVSGGASTRLLEEYALDPLTVGLDGKVSWSAERAGLVVADHIILNINEYNALIDATVDCTDTLRVERLNVAMTGVDVASLMTHAPAAYHKMLDGIDTDMTADLSVRLTAPYCPSDTLHPVPSIEGQLIVPKCHFHWHDTHFDSFEFTTSVSVDGRNLDRSTLNIEHLDIKGRAVDINLNGRVSGPLNDPYIDANLAAALRLQQLPEKLLEQLPVTIKGKLDAQTGIRMHLNDLSAERFHRAYLDGRLVVTDLDLQQRDSSLSVTAPRTVFELGTTRSVDGAEERIDSMLTMKLEIDTASIYVPGLNMQVSKLTAGLGTLNRSSSTDTTKINPFGGLIRMESFTIDQPHDTLTVRLREIETQARLTRYKGMEKNPNLTFDLHARRIGTRMPDFAILVSQPHINVNAHLIPRTPRDSTRRRLGGHRHINERDTILNDDLIDWNVSSGLKRILLRWYVDGTLSSNRGFVFMRDFPLRQRASDIDIHFGTDTVSVRSMNYSMGNSRLEVTGEVTNIKRALAGRTGRSKLKADFMISAPYIDINELATTTFYEASGNAGPDPDYDEEAIYRSTAVTTDTTARRAVIIPKNIDANLGLRADSILYADLLMHDMTGSIMVNNSAVNLHDFKASTDIGDANLTALYWAPDTANMQFGLGMELNRFDIGRVLKLIPAIDSLLPAMRGFDGVINADLAATSAITPDMDIDLASFKGALKLEGDSLVLLDADTFKMLAKWLVFKNKKRNMIDHMNVEIVVDNSQVEIFPFIFDIDRYKLGVMGRNDLDMNLDYHVSVLKSPLPFKFGINIRGQLDDLSIRLGGAKIKPGEAKVYAIADTTRINLLSQIEDVFKRGSMSSRSMRLAPRPIVDIDSVAGVLSSSDSLLMKQEGLLPPDTVAAPINEEKKQPLWKRIF